MRTLILVVGLAALGAGVGRADNDSAPDVDVSGIAVNVSGASGPSNVNVADLPEATPGAGAVDVGVAPTKPSDASLDPPTNDF